MATNQPQDDFHKTGLRLPKDLHARLHEAAAESGRSYNSELVHRLQQSFERPGHFTASTNESVQADDSTKSAVIRERDLVLLHHAAEQLLHLLKNVQPADGYSEEGESGQVKHRAARKRTP